MATALYPGYPHFHDIPTLDANLGVLLARFSAAALTAQIRDAFGATEGKWQAAMTELLAFSRLQQDGQLDCIGWPPSAPGTTPPFEGRLLDVNAANQPIAFDVKNASNVGLRLLEDALFPLVTAWCSANGLPQAEIEFDTSGPVTQEIVGPAKSVVRNITLENIDLQVGKPEVVIKNVENLKVNNLKINGTLWTAPGQANP